MNRSDTPNIEMLLAQRDWLCGLAHHLVGDPHRAEDLAQESLMRAMAHPPAVGADLARLRAWLAVVVKRLAANLGRSEARRASREKSVAHEEGELGSAELVMRADLQRVLVSAVLELSEPSRTAILRRYLEGMTVAEIALREGLDPGAVRKRINRGLERLRARFDANYPGGREEWCSLFAPLSIARQHMAGGVSVLAQVGVALVLLLGVSAWGASWLPAFWQRADGTPSESVTKHARPVEKAESSASPLASTLASSTDGVEPRVAAIPAGVGARSEALVFRLVSDSSGRPLPGVHILLESPSSGSMRAAPYVERSKGKPDEVLTTNSLGLVEITAPPGLGQKPAKAGLKWMLRLLGEDVGHEERTLVLTSWSPGADGVLEIRLAPDPPTQHWIRLVDDQTAAPIVGARCHAIGMITITRSELNRFADPWVRAEAWTTDGNLLGTSDATGSLHFERQSSRGSVFRVAAPGYSPTSVSLGSPSRSPAAAMEIELTRAGGIFGVLQDAGGQAITDATIGVIGPAVEIPRDSHTFGGRQVHLWRTRSDDRGRFQMADLPAGVELSWEARVGGESITGAARSVHLKPGGSKDVSLQLEAPGRVSGRLLTATGQPLPDVNIRLHPCLLDTGSYYLPKSQAGSRTVRTNSSGEFRFDDVSESEYFVGPAPHTNRQADSWAPLGIRILAPASNLELVARALTIRGRVSTEAGSSLANATVTATPAEGLGVVTATTNAEGAFEIGPLTAGVHRLSVRSIRETLSSGWVSAHARLVESGATGAHLEMVRSASLSGSVALENGRANGTMVKACPKGGLTGFSLTMCRGAGEFTLGPLVPGVYDIAALTVDGRVGVVPNMSVESGQKLEDIMIAPVNGGTVVITREGTGPRADYWLESQGVRFDLLQLAGGSRKEVSAPPGSLRVVPLRILAGVTVREAKVEVGEMTVIVLD